jgi:hypothetical protein
MAANPDQCALAVDRSLLDASAIIFYNDPDNDTPLPNSSATPAPTHPFFQGSLAPAKITAGSVGLLELFGLQLGLLTLTMWRLPLGHASDQQL